MFDDMIMNYSVRYQLASDTGGSATLHESSTSITLHGLAPNVEYNVSVTGINSCGGTSTFTMATFDLQGNILFMIKSSVLLLCIVVLAPTPTSSCGTITTHFQHCTFQNNLFLNVDSFNVHHCRSDSLQTLLLQLVFQLCPALNVVLLMCLGVPPKSTIMLR